MTSCIRFWDVARSQNIVLSVDGAEQVDQFMSGRLKSPSRITSTSAGHRCKAYARLSICESI